MDGVHGSGRLAGFDILGLDLLNFDWLFGVYRKKQMVYARGWVSCGVPVQMLGKMQSKPGNAMFSKIRLQILKFMARVRRLNPPLPLHRVDHHQTPGPPHWHCRLHCPQTLQPPYFVQHMLSN